MKQNLLTSYLSGFLHAAKMLVDYPKIERLWAKLKLNLPQTPDSYIVIGFAIIGLVIGLIGAFGIWFLQLILPGAIGVIFGTVLLFMLVELKDRGNGLILLSKYIGSRLGGDSHEKIWQTLNDNKSLHEESFSTVALTLAVLIKLMIYFLIVSRNCAYMFIPLIMVNYCTQGLLASNRNLNNKVFFHLDLHDLDKFYLISAVLLFVGVHLNFVVWLFVVFVFAMHYLLLDRFGKNCDRFSAETLTLSGEMSEVVLLVILGLYLV